ncbi:MAG TPA: adventurous gliding motility lipoprotein CglC [Fredinandcohnia sp.]|nr:adventurous gliding motility lipoprotein CglC [Fredinandcohnia sp.]
MGRHPFLLGLSLLLLSAGTCAESDIGAPCQLQKTRMDPTIPGCEDVRPDQLNERPGCFRPNLEDLAAGRDKDFISFGVAECDNLTCVRSRGAPLPSSEAEPAGACSGECITDADCQGVESGYVCRELVFDDAFLRSLRETLSEAEYERYLGRIQNAKFCARR